MDKNINSGLYIVTLTNDHPISVNANDPRVADKAIKVTKDNCKFGKAKVLEGRRNNYYKTFGEQYVNFVPIVLLEHIVIAEKEILRLLYPFRIKGRTGRRNEWLEKITPKQVERIIISCLDDLGLPYKKIGEI